MVCTAANLPTNVTLANNSSITFNQASSGTLNAAVGGTGSFTKMGTALLAIAVPQTYSGATNVAAGTLQLGANTVSPVLHFTMNGTTGTIATAATLTDATGNGHTGTLADRGKLRDREV